jgi:WD40 repeat protein
MAFSPDASLLATASDDGAVRLWDPRTGQQASLTGPTNGVNAVAFSPDATLLATASGDGTILLWDPTQRTPCSRLRLDGPVRALHWGIDGIAAGSGTSVLVLDLIDKPAGQPSAPSEPFDPGGRVRPASIDPGG